MKRSTIQEVAHLAGVSTATVSHVINGTRFVSDETRCIVEKAIKELSYYPDLGARNLKIGKRHAIGFISPDLTNSYFSNIVDEVEEVVKAAGYSLLIGNSKDSLTNEKELLKYYSSGLVDAIIDISSALSCSDIEKIVPKNIPLLLIDREVDAHMTYDSIIVSTYDSIYQATREVLKRNAGKRIGYLASADELHTTQERKRAFLDAVSEVGLSPEDYCIVDADSTARVRTGQAYDEVGNMINNDIRTIVASTNLLTQEALRFIYEHNLIPVEDIDIVGFFNQPYVYPYPGMIWINMPGREMGRLAGTQILEKLNNQNNPPVHQIIFSSVMNKIID